MYNEICQEAPIIQPLSGVQFGVVKSTGKMHEFSIILAQEEAVREIIEAIYKVMEKYHKPEWDLSDICISGRQEGPYKIKGPFL